MKFKIGDKIKHKDFGVGKIVYIDEESAMPYAVEFETFNKDLHGLGFCGAPKVEFGHGDWCEESDLELYTQQPQNLIPQIAKMLGVEIGEKFKISKNSDVFEFTKDKLIGIDSVEVYNAFSIFFELITGKKKIIKLPPKSKPILTEDEKAILRNLPKEYKWIARDEDGFLFVFSDKPKNENGVFFSEKSYEEIGILRHLFQFISCGDEEPYNIEELLKGE